MVAWGRELTQLLHARSPSIPKPVIAAITGYALGGGYELALCADFRVLGASAKIGQPEIQLGVIPGAGGTQRLARLVGPAKAKDLIFTGRHVGAEEALEIGLADAVVPDDEVYSTAVAMARSSPPVRRWPWPRPSRPSTRASTCRWTTAWRWRAGCSPSCSTPRTRRSACAPSWRAAPARRSSPAADAGRVTFTTRSCAVTAPRRPRSATIATPAPCRSSGPGAAGTTLEDTCDEAPCGPRSRSSPPD